jgi:hypothetical protein
MKEFAELGIQRAKDHMDELHEMIEKAKAEREKH